jgi:hypothetical protein
MWQGPLFWAPWNRQGPLMPSAQELQQEMESRLHALERINALEDRALATEKALELAVAQQALQLQQQALAQQAQQA